VKKKPKVEWDSLSADDQKAFIAYMRSRHGKRMASLPVTNTEEAARELFDRWPRALQERQEVAVAMFLDEANRVISFCELARGYKTGVSMNPRMILEKLLKHNAATKIILAHNHLSGDPEPSEQDVRVTRKLLGTFELVGVLLMDHLVVGRSECGTPTVRSVIDYMNRKGGKR